VQNPFRFFKKPTAFAMHEEGVPRSAGQDRQSAPGEHRVRTERALNDPNCTDKSTPAKCANTARKGYERSRLGWAAQTLDQVCYERHSRPFRYPVVCERQYSWGSTKEDLHPADAHTVDIGLSAERLAMPAQAECTGPSSPARAARRPRPRSRRARTSSSSSACCIRMTPSFRAAPSR